MVEDSDQWVEQRGYKNPAQGFGRLWRRSYRVALPGADGTPRELIRVWKEEFAAFWPQGSRIANLERITQAGETAEIHIAGPLGLTFITGFAVQRADEERFELMTREDHFFSGIIAFTAYYESGVLVAQTEATVRPSDPIWETLYRAGILPAEEDKFWVYTLARLAERFGVAGEVSLSATLLDRRVAWRNWRRVFGNLGAKTVFRLANRPGEALSRRLPLLKQQAPETQKRAALILSTAAISAALLGVVLLVRRLKS